ncbi:hypothetical protein ANTQUA_LOCUS10249 [Anthophora quadrimaculata]
MHKLETKCTIKKVNDPVALGTPERSVNLFHVKVQRRRDAREPRERVNLLKRWSAGSFHHLGDDRQTRR